MPRNISEKIKVALFTLIGGLLAFVGCASCLLVVGCGGSDAVVIKEPAGEAKAYTFATAQKDCGGCHSGDAFMGSESAFKAYAPNLALVQGGKMPKGNPYDTATKEKFAQYFNAK